MEITTIYRERGIEVLAERGGLLFLYEGRGRLLSTDEAEALYLALAAHLGHDAPLPGWRATEYSRDGWAVKSDPSVGGGWWGYQDDEDEETGLPGVNRAWLSEINLHDGFRTALDAMRAVEELAARPVERGEKPWREKLQEAVKEDLERLNEQKATKPNPDHRIKGGEKEEG